MKRLFILFFVLTLWSCSGDKEANDEEDISDYIKTESVMNIEGKDQAWLYGLKSDEPVEIDGKMDDQVWSQVNGWYRMDQVWLGGEVTPEDFWGGFKIAWDESKLYVLVKVYDDTLIDIYEDPAVKYWNDDCVEVFIDPDNSDDNHQYNYNAWAYHIALDGKVADIGPDSAAHLYDHVESARVCEGDTCIWELSFELYADDYQDEADNKPLTLNKDLIPGFMIAYCDNDTSELRENFIGSIPIEGEDKDQGWIDAGVFNTLKLVELKEFQDE